MDQNAFETALGLIRGDRRHGAADLARRALDVLAESAQGLDIDEPRLLRRELEVRAERLIAARPSMAPLANLIADWRAELPGRPTDAEALRAIAVDAAHALVDASREATRDAADHAADLIPDGATVVTHSLSATVRGALLKAGGRGAKVIVTESRPLNEGVDLAEALAEAGVAVTVITDAQMALACAGADLCLVGADTVLADGGVVNKAGTCLLALAARAAGIPFLVVCESFKRRADPDPPPLEEMADRELGHELAPGIGVRNVYFDVTPANLVSRLITERG